MLRKLTEAQVETYRRDGYLCPVPAFSAEHVALCRQRLDAIMAAEGGMLTRRTNQKPHLLFPWLSDMIRDPAILDAVEDVLGPDLLVWGSSFFLKAAQDPAFVSWHQDVDLLGPVFARRHHGLGGLYAVDAGGGRHARGPRHALADQHAAPRTSPKRQLLTRGQEVRSTSIAGGAVDIVLKPGEMSLHHVLIVHGSEPNRADRLAHRLCHPLHPDPRAPGRGRRATAPPWCAASTATDHFDHEPAPDSRLSDPGVGGASRCCRAHGGDPLRRHATQSFENVVRTEKWLAGRG